MEELLNKAEELVSKLREDATKFTEKGNNTAGTRTRKHAMDLKHLMGDIRTEVTVIKHKK